MRRIQTHVTQRSVKVVASGHGVPAQRRVRVGICVHFVPFLDMVESMKFLAVPEKICVIRPMYIIFIL